MRRKETKDSEIYAPVVVLLLFAPKAAPKPLPWVLLVFDEPKPPPPPKPPPKDMVGDASYDARVGMNPIRSSRRDPSIALDFIDRAVDRSLPMETSIQSDVGSTCR